MQVVKYRKISNNKYLIILDNQKEIEVYEDIILKYNLILEKEITNVEALLKENKIYACYYNALDFLKSKSKSEQEIIKHLKKGGYTEENINHTITKLKEQKYIDDIQYASQYLQEKLALTMQGPNKIRQNLLNKGIKEEIIFEVLKKYDYEEQLKKVDKIINRIINKNKDKSQKYLKLKIYNELIAQGFYQEVIDDVMKTKDLKDDKENILKETEKLRKKYFNKYSGTKLEYKIKSELIRKGYNVY